jgi:hypothetical protein
VVVLRGLLKVSDARVAGLEVVRSWPLRRRFVAGRAGVVDVVRLPKK